MDLKSKGLAFVGNFFQKFETICHDMDSMSQDKVKYVESQVHTVGENMKRLVQDLIPLSLDPVNREVQKMSPEENAATTTHIRSTVGDEDSHGHTTVAKQTPIWPSDINLPKENAATTTCSRSMAGDEDSQGHTALAKQTPIWPSDINLPTNWLDGTFSKPPEKLEPDFSQRKLEDVSTNKIDDQFASLTSIEPIKEAVTLHQADSDLSAGELEDISTNRIDMNQLDNSFHENCPIDEFTTPSSSKDLEVADSDLAPRELEDVSINNLLGKPFSEPHLIDKLPTPTCSKPLEDKSDNVNQLNEPFNEAHLLDQLTALTSSESLEEADEPLDEADSNSVPGELANFSTTNSADRNPLGNSFKEPCLVDQLTNPTNSKSLKEAEYFSADRRVDDFLINKSGDMRTLENKMKENPSKPLSAPSEKKSFEVSLSNELINRDCENACGLEVGDSSSISVNEEQFHCPQKVGTVHDCVSDASSTNASSFSVASCESKILGAQLASSTSSEPLTLGHNAFNNILTTYTKPANVSACNSDNFCCLLPSVPAPTVPSEYQVETRLASSNSVLLLESTGCANDCNNITKNGMETIDLTDNVKLEESSALVDDSMLHEVSRRVRKLRSYKKKLQDAFTGNRRLIKEYKQLAIWYGDIDSHNDITQSSMSSTTTIQINEPYNSEWEIL